MPPEELVLFLDENLHNCQPILHALEEAGISCERHSTHFLPGTPDSVWLPFVGSSGWLLITPDQRIRYNELERRAIQRYRVRAFVFTTGNLSGVEMARLLVSAFTKMKRVCAKNDPPFIASITKSGEVHVRFDKFGSVHARRKKPDHELD